MSLIYNPKNFDGILEAIASQDKTLADELRWQLQDGLILGGCVKCECGIDDDGLCYTCGQDMRTDIERLHNTMTLFRWRVIKGLPQDAKVEFDRFLTELRSLTDYLPPRR